MNSLAHVQSVYIWRSHYNGAPMLPSFLRKLRELRDPTNTGKAQSAPGQEVLTSLGISTFSWTAPEKEPIGGDSLFSFVDLKDPFTPSEVAGEDLLGPILSLMGARQFEFLFLFHTPHTRNNALATESEVSRRYPDCRVRLHELPVSDPKDYSAVMARLTRAVRDLVGQVSTRGAYVCISSGTAEMRGAWFLLTAVGVLPARLVQVDILPFGHANVTDIVDTRDWHSVREVLMPAGYRTSGWMRDQRGHKLSVEPEEMTVPGLDNALQELGIHVGSAVLRYAAERAGIAAGSPLPVLLLGETGTGKERFAHLIHRLSPRCSYEMVAINCAAIPKDLAESHLFGHIKGSFSGAIADKKGVFESADQSTLFLDEVAELPLEIQAKLLRVIQDGSFQRVGSTMPCRVDVRIIAATNRDLAKEVDAGRFREDLYFRLEVLQIKLPALRERRAEIPELALALLRQINQRRLKPRQLSKEALLRLERYDWPGNVRELSNVLERSVLYAPNESLGADHLQIKGNEKSVITLFDLPEPYEGFSLEEYMGRIRKQLILRALEMSKGNQAEAGRLLGISRQAINKFMAEQPDNPS